MANRKYVPKFQKGGYFGAEAMAGEKGLDIRNLFQGLKAKEKVFQKGQAKRGKLRGWKDLGRKFLDFIDPTDISGTLLDVFGEQYIQKKHSVEGGPDLSELETMWTGGEGTASQEEWEKIYGASDETLLEGIIRGVGDYAGDGFDLSSLFARKGGRVPKYENGGLLSKLKFGKKKKDKVPERDEALVALDAILSSKPPVGEHGYERNGTGGYSLLKDVLPYISDKGQSRWKGRQIAEFDTSEGKRYYPGEGTSVDMQNAIVKALIDATQRINVSPEDSITTDQFEKLRELGLFEGGGQVPKYYGGGSVSGDSPPTIAGYFSGQGKTLGGSNTQSLAEKLGRK